MQSLGWEDPLEEGMATHSSILAWRIPCTVDVGDVAVILGPGRPPGGGHGNPLQHSCLENPIDRGAWWAPVHGVTKRQTRLKQAQKRTQDLGQ